MRNPAVIPELCLDLNVLPVCPNIWTFMYIVYVHIQVIIMSVYRRRYGQMFKRFYAGDAYTSICLFILHSSISGG